ncbi:hypothetical protein A1D28_05035 [Pasteurella multocida]|nr:hypothetical protein [Pasteurella multocida]
MSNIILKGDIKNFHRQNQILGSVIALLDVLEQADFDELKGQTANEALKGIGYLVKEISNIQFDFILAGVEVDDE